MKIQTVEILENDSKWLEAFNLFITVRLTFGRECDVVVGSPGLYTETRRAATGDAILYENQMGIFDVRVLSQSSSKVRFQVTQLSPAPSIAGAFSSSDRENTVFSSEELQRIAVSIDEAKNKIQSSASLQAEQIQLICRKLDEVKDASNRLGRKDWINYTAGVITSACVSAAFAPNAAKDIFMAINAAFSWIFSTGLLALK